MDEQSTYRGSLEKLAKSLVKNHLRTDLRYHNWGKLVQNGDDLRQDIQRRVIAVIGAGCSIEAGLPLSHEAIEILLKRLNVPQKFFEQEVERLESVYRLNRKEFETALLAFSSLVYSSDEVREHLQELYATRYSPLLCYEIIAHLFKHRFIDAIISFNFDEILDQTVIDELGRDEFHYVITEGTCPEILNEPNELFDLPVFIKPHGTASQKATLRFTREAYHGLPIDIRKTIQALFRDMPVTVIAIGFNMQSFEFNNLANKAREDSEIFYINKIRPQPEPDLTAHYSEHFIKVEAEEEGLDAVLKKLWEMVSANFSDSYKPRGIMRHELIAKIFKTADSRPENQKDASDFIENYLHDRTIIELALSIAKSKGLANMSVLANDRCGQYYELYKAKAGAKKILLFEMCHKIGLKDIGYSREALRLGGGESPKSNGILRKEKFSTKLNSDVIFRLLSARFANNLLRYKNFFESTLIDLYTNNEIEISAKADCIYSKIFSRPVMLKTKTGLSFITEDLIQNAGWNKLFIIAETGEWLLMPNIQKAIKSCDSANRLYLIVADPTFEDKLREKYGDRLAEIKRMSWWDHNRHATIFVKDRMPIASVYFTRRLRSTVVHPVLLKEINDSNVVFESFIAYWNKGNSEWLGPDDLDPKDFFDRLPR